jgi:hypothetical protein
LQGVIEPAFEHQTSGQRAVHAGVIGLSAETLFEGLASFDDAVQLQ